MSTVKIKVTQDVCYKLVGCPPGYKGMKKQEYRLANATMNDNISVKDDAARATTNVNNSGPNQVMHNYFMDEQYNKILRLLNQDKEEDFAYIR